MKPRILYLITQDDLGGAQRYVLDLALTYKDRADVTIALGPDGSGWLSKNAEKANISLIRLRRLHRAIRPLDDLATVSEIRAIFKQGWDVVHLNSTKAGVLAGLAGLMCSQRPRIVYTAHGWVFLEPLHPFQKILYLALEWLSARGRDRTIVLSEKEQRIAKKKLMIPDTRIAVIPHSPPAALRVMLEPAAARSELGLPSNNRITVIGTVANLYPTKGIDVLIKAASQKVLKDKQWLIVVVGQGPEKERLISLIKEYKLEQRVLLLGSREDAQRYLSAFDVFVLPSRKEGLPYILLDAMVAGLPIIATDVGAISETVGNCAKIVPPENPEALAQALSDLIADETEQRRLAEKIKTRAAELRQQPASTEKTWEFYKLN